MLKNTAQVSVIIPVYNISGYIEKCVDSLLAQTFTNLQILLIDDGSTDGSSTLCDEIAGKDERVKVFHYENGGAATARNRGLDNACGEYIAFIDGDDYVENNYIEELYNEIIISKADAAMCGSACVCDGVIDKASVLYTLDKGNVSGREAVIDYYEKSRAIYISPCGKIFKKSVFMTIRFPDGKLKEDAYFFPILYDQLRRIVRTDKSLYYYVQRDDSATHSEITEAEFEHRLGYRRFHYEFYKGKHDDELECYSWLALCEYLLNIYKTDEFAGYIKKIREEYKKVCTMHNYRKYKAKMTLKRKLRFWLGIVDIDLYALIRNMRIQFRATV